MNFFLLAERPLEAVDRLAITRQTIMRVAREHDIHTTFHLRSVPGTAGNGAHGHLLRRGDE